MDNSLKDIIRQLEDMFQTFNGKFFNGELEQPVITVSPDTTKGAYGWCTTWKAWSSKDKTEGNYEINLCAEHLSREFPEVAGTLLHEMVHLYNIYNGVKDTSRSGTYHNKKFKDAAEAHGLIVEATEKYGWSTTKLNDDALSLISSDGFEIFRESISTKKKSKSKSSSIKYVCPCCGTSVRATKHVRIVCADCEEFMQEA